MTYKVNEKIPGVIWKKISEMVKNVVEARLPILEMQNEGSHGEQECDGEIDDDKCKNPLIVGKKTCDLLQDESV